MSLLHFYIRGMIGLQFFDDIFTRGTWEAVKAE
jgi:hypothetical protein